MLFHVDNSTKEIFDSKIIVVEPSLRFNDTNEVVSVYAYYLQTCIKDTLGIVTELNYLQEELYSLVSTQPAELPNWSSHVVALPRYTSCKTMTTMSANKRLRQRKVAGPYSLTGDFSAGGYCYRGGCNVYK